VDLLAQYGSAFVRGAGVTALLTVTSFTLAVLIGALLTVMRISPVAPLRIAASGYTGLMRCIPLLALLVLFVFGLPKLGFTYSLLTSTVLVLGLYASGFVAETLRAGVRTIPRGQLEAARALGLTFSQVLRTVVLPQAFRSVVPPLGNLAVSQIKATAIAAAIGLREITGTANRVNFETARPVEVFAIAALVYLALAVPAGYGIGWLERRLAVSR